MAFLSYRVLPDSYCRSLTIQRISRQAESPPARVQCSMSFLEVTIQALDPLAEGVSEPPYRGLQFAHFSA